MKYNPSRARAPIRELWIMKINYNNRNNWQIIGINRDYWRLLEIIAIICTKFYNVYNSINLPYWFVVLLLDIIVIIWYIAIIVIIVWIVIIDIIVCIVIIGFYLLV